MVAVSGGALFGTQGGVFGLGGTGITGAGITNVLGDVGGVFSGFQQSEGYRDEAKLYEQGEIGALQQAGLAKDTEQLQAFQLQRKVALTESAQRAAAAANGLSESGSVVSLLRESAIQGNEAQGNLMFNTEQKVAQLDEQAEAARQQKMAARDAAFGSVVGGLLKGVAGIVGVAGML